MLPSLLKWTASLLLLWVWVASASALRLAHRVGRLVVVRDDVVQAGRLLAGGVGLEVVAEEPGAAAARLRHR